MLTYTSSYKTIDGVLIGTVLDFPGTVAYGTSLDEARQNLATALRDMAETSLLKGEPLPVADPAVTDADAELEEPIHLMLQTGQQLSMSTGSVQNETA
jgi:predicted RNase H-like HicB family nuclease